MVGPVPAERHGLREGMADCGVCEWCELLTLTYT